MERVLTILQTLSSQEQDDYGLLVKHLELRYGQTHLEYVYHCQLKNRNQGSNESLEQFWADVVRLICLAYPAMPEDIKEMILARLEKLVDALARTKDCQGIHI